MIFIHNSYDGREVLEADFYVLSKVEHHAASIIDTDGVYEIKKLTSSSYVGDDGDLVYLVIVDRDYSPMSGARYNLYHIFDDVEITKDISQVLDYLLNK